MSRTLVLHLVGDVVTQAVRGIGAGLDGIDLVVHHHLIDQHRAVLLDDARADVLLCHARASYFTDERSDEEAVTAAEDYVDAVLRHVATGSTLVVLNTVFVSPERVVGIEHLHRLRTVARINDVLACAAERSPHVSIADIAGTVARVGIDASINRRNELVMRMPYTRHVLPAIAAEYERVIGERLLPRKKVLVLDADETLWGGIVGEDGVHGIACDERFPGVVHRRFQAQLRALRDSGVVLALASRNNEADVREAFDTLDMPLSWESFSTHRVSWQPKSESIRAIAAELNVGLDTLVFIDDNPFELEEVAAALPEVTTCRFEAGAVDQALGLLAGIRGLGTWSITSEDRERAETYLHECERRGVAARAHSLEDYVRSLDIEIEMGTNRTGEVQRLAQLTNRTNQFNLTTRRCSEADILGFMREGQVFDFRVRDRFGDMGIVGLAIVVEARIEVFLLSCRAFGRRVEEHMLDAVRDRFPDEALRARYVPTRKNAMVADFYERNGFDVDARDCGCLAGADAAGECVEYVAARRVPRAITVPVTAVDSVPAVTAAMPGPAIDLPLASSS